MIVTTWRSKEGFWLWVPTLGLLWDKPQINFESVTPLQWSPSWWWSTPLQRSDLSSSSWSLNRTVIILFIFHHHDGQFHLSERVGKRHIGDWIHDWMEQLLSIKTALGRHHSCFIWWRWWKLWSSYILFSTTAIGKWRGRSFSTPSLNFHASAM